MNTSIKRTSFLTFMALALVLIATLTPNTAQAQRRDSTRRFKRPPVIVVPTVGYGPETRGFLGAVGLSAFRLGKNDTRVSNAKAEFQYTQNKQLSTEIGANVFTRNDRHFLNALVGYRKFPEYWWGIGNNTPKSHKERYQAKRLEIDMNLFRKLKKGWFVGAAYTLRSMYDIRPTKGGILDNEKITGKRGGSSSGFGLGILHDNRDNILNPQKGAYLDLRHQFFHKLLGSDFQFSRMGMDARTYIPLKRKRVLALQAKLALQSGQPPFRMLSLLGSSSDMRGYYQGRYRDRHYYTVQAEYRMPLIWRLGMAAFAGFGDVGFNLHDMGTSVFKYSLGGGLRVCVDRAENINIRFDYAVGRATSAFYIGFGEAF